ncbi:diguanylate cyclase [Geomesophilobacter sediminis]|uniref:diguanylate cyclase n=1 Tax=Geomesophilobacter sediminis TaxID=2798584 RepID=A0A8J7JMQ5_9BACT|nr:diguanylate cyclase [Geomesophilobacter sediminis]MBJ6726210.1 diguanylate cyclase [Geomesophilobacter sediminis]
MSASVLVIDDSPKVRDKVIRTLKDVSLFSHYREANDGLEGFKSLMDSPSDLVLCDVEMPRMDGFRFLQMVNSRQELQGIPIIMLTGILDFGSKIKGLNLGAIDYLTKPFDAGELVARVRVQLKIKTLQDELRRANEQLTRLTNTDDLTGLFNRRYLTDSLSNEFIRAQRYQDNLTLVIFDIDHFKVINDNYGHQNGDHVLAAVAAAAQQGLRPYDVAARYGGEEFVMVIPGATLAEGVAVAERLRVAVQNLSFPAPMEGVKVTISLGVANYPAAPVSDIASLFHLADQALYRAKQTGRNRVEVMAHSDYSC